MNPDLRAMSALRIVLLGVIVAWVLFIAGSYDLYSHTWYDGSPDSAGVAGSAGVAASRYFFLAAVAAGGAAALWGKRRVQAIPPTRQQMAVYQHAVAALIVAIAAGGWAFLVLIFDLFMTDYSSIALRVVNTYLPIVLFTALVLFFLLAGFVFNRPDPQPAGPSQEHLDPLPSAAGDSPDAPGTSGTAGAPDAPGVPGAPGAPGTPEPAADTRSNALAYAVPIASGAVATIIGGVVYDATRTPLTAWVWALIFAIVAAGIIAGTLFASKLPRSAGAFTLNSAWVIAFTVVVMISAFAFGAASIDRLRLESGISMDVFTGEGHMSADITGYELLPRSEAVLTAGSTPVHTARADGDGWFYESVQIPEDAGEGELRLRALARDGTELSAGVPIGAGEDSAYDDVTETLPISASWFIKDVLPAFIMLLTSCALLYLTIPLRARAGVRAQAG